ncbi:MAG TPA: hypothetical protein GXX30_03940 [Firmicutes bacterium]|nr:hypothetical protein [Candidatus Fermentithermobacillaceae bacterium]
MQAGEGIGRIARNLGVERDTAKKYVRSSMDEVFKARKSRSKAEWIEFIRKAFPEVAEPINRHKIFVLFDAVVFRVPCCYSD